MDIKQLAILIFDCEVYAYDWIVVFLDRASKDFYVFHNDCDSIQIFLKDHGNYILTGFNVKHYDRFILSAICNDADNARIKDINDFIIIDSGEGWNYPMTAFVNAKFSLCDLKDDCYQGLGLKDFEAHSGANIKETEVPFDLDRPLTDDELESVIKYCKYDVTATDRLFDLRLPYLQSKLTLGAEAGLSADAVLYMTNAKLTAAYLKASAQKHDDERDYKYPDNLLREYIPDDVFRFFDRIRDPSISSECLFDESLNIELGGCTITMGWGGIHGAIPCYEESSTDTRTIHNVDAASYYPHQMIINGYCSRNMLNPNAYADTIKRRIAAKKAGDKATANALKLVLNTTFGAMLNQYNDLYDPLMARSVCISGQLQLLELAGHLVHDCPSLKLIQLNTDGIMISIDNTDVERYKNITAEWQQRTGFELEEDIIRKIAQKDVNNYVEVPCDGDPKVKGGILTRGISQAGQFKINNSTVIVAKAVTDYFANDTPPAVTIAEDNNLFDFQIIAKAGSKYEYAFQLIDGKEVKVQNVNRIYAVGLDQDFRSKYGTLYKKHKTSGTVAKIAGLPAHCRIDNSNELTIDDIDKNWYILEANRYINAFKGIPENSAVNTRKINQIKKQILKSLETNTKITLF